MSEHFCVSVIVPFYNAVVHLKRCIDVLLKQDFNKSAVLHPGAITYTLSHIIHSYMTVQFATNSRIETTRVPPKLRFSKQFPKKCKNRVCIVGAGFSGLDLPLN